MFKSSLEICSQGYNVAQTDYYISNLESRLIFAETAYADAVRRIKALEEQNQALTSALDNKLALMAEKLGIEVGCEKPVDTETDIQQDNAEKEPSEESCDVESENNISQESITVESIAAEPDEDITSLKTQIDELKSFFKNN